MKIPFIYKIESQEFLNAYAEIIDEINDKHLFSMGVNVFHLPNGNQFRFENQIQTLELKNYPLVEATSKDVIEQNTKLITETMDNNINCMKESIVNEIKNSIEENENVPKVLKKSCLYETYLEVLAAIELNYHKGKINLIKFHDFPQDFDYFFKNAPADLCEKYKKLIEQKTLEAITKEENRLSKYKQ